MKIRTALFVATLLLFSISTFAEGPARAAADQPDRADAAVSRAGRAADLQDRYDRTPKIAYVFDGVEFPANTPLPDGPLTWVITREDYEKGTFHVFTSRDVAQTYMKRRTPAVSSNGAKVTPNWPGYCSWTNSYSRFEKSRWCGDSTYLTMYPPNDSYTELDSISWNNSISCVYAACDWYWTTLYACRNFVNEEQPGCDDPYALYIEGGLIVQDLDNYGFNNRTSSMRFE
ncbi:MAG TPA: hypothetical protein VGF28_14360 [Thermoanaerobaculia bacterium]